MCKNGIGNVILVENTVLLFSTPLCSMEIFKIGHCVETDPGIFSTFHVKLRQMLYR
jgi:hypothetical protein